MAIIVLLRGINVGGRRSFRPTVLARQLEPFDVANIGAAGTFVVRKPQSRALFRAALTARLPLGTEFIVCESRALLQLSAQISVGRSRSRAGTSRFVSFLGGRVRVPPPLPLTIPRGRNWFVRVTTLTDRFAVGEYRRHMKTISCLGRLDAIFGTLVVTRSWSTVNAIVRMLQDEGSSAARR